MTSNEKKDIHTWFELTYASYLVLPRLLLDSMPADWQHKFVELLEQIPETLNISDDYTGSYSIQYREKGKFKADPYKDYRRGYVEKRPLNCPKKED